MKTIDRKTAALLWSHEYKLVDRDGLEYLIEGVYSHFICLWSSDHIEHADIKFDQIGTEYFVLCRNYDQLTKEIEHGVVPIIETFHIGWANTHRFEIHPSRPSVITDWTSMMYEGAKYVEFHYDKEEHSFTISVLNKDIKIIGHLSCKKQETLFDKFYSMHFKPSSLPDEACKFIELNK